MLYIIGYNTLPNLFPIDSILAFEVKVEVVSVLVLGTGPNFTSHWVGPYISKSGLDWTGLYKLGPVRIYSFVVQ